jgi:hypothetical protein
MAITGQGVFSFGTLTGTRPTGWGSSFTDFLKDQSLYRNTTVYILPTTPEEEKAIRAYLDSIRTKNMPDAQSHPIDGSKDNCAVRTKDSLKVGGIDLGDISTPKGLQDALEKLVKAGKATVAPIPKNAPYMPPFLQTFNPNK